jgi:Fic family protein
MHRPRLHTGSRLRHNPPDAAVPAHGVCAVYRSGRHSGSHVSTDVSDSGSCRCVIQPAQLAGSPSDRCNASDQLHARTGTTCPVATVESVGSSTRIEGARLSDYEVEALLANLELRSFHSRDEAEVAGYAGAMNLIFDSWEYIPLTENHLKQLHGILLKHCSWDSSHRGEYKKLPNNMEAFDASGQSIGIIFATASPFETPALMTELVQGTAAALDQRELHPLLVIGAFVVRFLAIHPFHDGNGRLSRIVTTLLLLRSGYGYVPYSSLERVVEENKDGYYRALRASQIKFGTDEVNLDDWVRFFLQILKRQKDALLHKVEQERLVAQVPQLSERLLVLARERGRLSISDAVTLLAVNRNTAKIHLRQLVKQGYLAQHGVGKGTWYTVVR